MCKRIFVRKRLYNCLKQNCWLDRNETSERIVIKINFSINFSINFFIIAINLFSFNYWLLFEAIAVHPMGVGVSVSLPLEMGLDCQVSGLKAVLFCQWECANPALKHHHCPVLMLLFGLIFLLLRLLYISEQLAGWPYLNLCTANHCTMITRDQVNIRPMTTAYGLL